MRYLSIFILCLLCYSCNERIVQLPETTNGETTKIHDVSSIYLFYDEVSDSVEFNRKNMIGSTNWLVAIDKRASLQQALPHLQYLFTKRHAEGMHTNEDAKSYFACSNTAINTLSFIESTDIDFIEGPMDPIIVALQNKPVDSTSTSKTLYLKAKTMQTITVGIDSLKTETTLSKLGSTLNKYTSNSGIEYTVHLGFQQALSFQDYIRIKTTILDLQKENVKTAPKEFIFN